MSFFGGMLLGYIGSHVIFAGGIGSGKKVQDTTINLICDKEKMYQQDLQLKQDIKEFMKLNDITYKE